MDATTRTFATICARRGSPADARLAARLQDGGIIETEENGLWRIVGVTHWDNDENVYQLLPITREELH